MQPLVERAADPLGDAAVNLTLDDRRVDQHAAVVHDDVAHEAKIAGERIDFDDRGVLTTRPGCALRREEAARLQPGLLAFAQHRAFVRFDQPQGRLIGLLAIGVADRIGGGRQRAQRQLASRRAPHHRLPLGEVQVARTDFEQLGRERQHLAHAPRRQSKSVARGHECSTGVRARAPVEAARIARHHRHVTNVTTELGGDDLREAGVVALALTGQPRDGQHAATRLDAHVGALVWPDAGALDVRSEPDAEVAMVCSRRRLPVAKAGQVDHLLGQGEPGWVVATVVLCRPAVLESQSDVPWKIVRLQEIAPPHFVRLERQLAGDPIDQALHDEARVGPTSASVRTDARRVGVDHGELGAIVRHLVGAW